VLARTTESEVIEDGYQLLRDHLIESFQEALDLGPYGPCHLHLTGQLNVLPLVGLSHGSTVPTRFEIFRLRFPKLLNLNYYYTHDYSSPTPNHIRDKVNTYGMTFKYNKRVCQSLERHCDAITFIQIQ